jgi:ArsR family transcriptional regulator
MPTTILDTAQAARWFHALSDETRLEIVAQLLSGERCVCELTDTLDAAQSRLSFHLKTLKDAGLVTDRRDGRWTYYTLDREVFREIDEYLDALRHAMRNPRNPRKRAGCCD